MMNKRMEHEKLHTIINILSGIVVMLVNLGINFVVSPYIVATLGEEANGFTQLANNFVTYASLLTVAFNSMAGRFISINYHRGNKEKVNQYYSSVLVCNLLIVIILLPIFAFVVQNIEKLINVKDADVGDLQILFTCVFANFLINLFVSVMNTAMYVKNMLFIKNTMMLIKSIANAAVLCIMFVFFAPRVFFTSLVESVLTVFVAVYAFYFHKKLMPELKFCRTDFKWKAVWEMFSSGIWNTINQGGNLLMTGLDLLVTNLFVSPSAMGTLAVAKTVPSAITSLASTLNANLAPTLTISWANGNKQEILDKLRSTMRVSAVLVSVPYMVFCAFGVEFYTLWMPSLDAKLLTLLSFLTCMAFIPWAGPQVLNNIFTASNRLRVSTVSFLCAGIINVIVVYILLKNTTLGIIAVAGVSSVITIIRCFTITAPYIAYLLNMRWYTFYKDAGLSVLCCVLNYVIARTVHYFINGSTWISLIIACGISGVLALGVDMIVILNKGERDNLLAKIPGFKK